LVIEGRLAPELQGLDVRPASECLAAQEPADPAAPPPKLVSSFPADGGKARPGIVVVRLTFDQPMACPGVNDGDLPICPTPLIDPVISADRRTFLTICVARSEGRYSIRLNSERGRRSLSADEHMTVSASQRPRGRWTSLAGRQAVSQEITFTTTNDETVQTIRDAIAEDPFLRDIVGRKTNAAATPSR
jgi:hypothetical protein